MKRNGQYGTYYAQTLWSKFDDTKDMHCQIDSESQLVSAAMRLGASHIDSWSVEERAITSSVEKIAPELAARLKNEILKGGDPLGEILCKLRSPEVRRRSGTTYTPIPVVEAMVSWAARKKLHPSRVIEPGTGSARFLMNASKAFPQAHLLGIEADPVASIVARANLAVLGLSKRARIVFGDFRHVLIPPFEGRTLYIGNPPYVRHHELDSNSKSWLSAQAKMLGFKASQLAGLHVHFFLATALKAQKEDFGAFITSAEWLDVNYGKLVRQLFLDHLGGEGMTIIEPTSRTFSDATTTAVITQFQVGSVPAKIRLNRSKDASLRESLVEGRWFKRERLDPTHRWSMLTRRAKIVQDGFVELGEFCRVHRGQVTGANRVWIAGEHSRMLPESVLFPSVTRARELFQAGSLLADVSNLRDVIDIAPDLSVFSKEERRSIDDFLARAKALGADSGYVAKNRKAWWSVGLRSPAPILATYMARRKPAFVRNLAKARHINIAHGIYPRDTLSAAVLDRLARNLSAVVSMTEGRTYAGGLTKFEPKEMERILIPNPTEMDSEQVA